MGTDPRRWDPNHLHELPWSSPQHLCWLPADLQSGLQPHRCKCPVLDPSKLALQNSKGSYQCNFHLWYYKTSKGKKDLDPLVLQIAKIWKVKPSFLFYFLHPRNKTYEGTAVIDSDSSKIFVVVLKLLYFSSHYRELVSIFYWIAKLDLQYAAYTVKQREPNEVIAAKTKGCIRHCHNFCSYLYSSTPPVCGVAREMKQPAKTWFGFNTRH